MADKVSRIRHLNPPEFGHPPGYSQIVETHSSRLVFIAGQTALDQNGSVIGKGDVARQADQVFRNLATALAAVGCTAANLVKLTVFLRDMITCPPTARRATGFSQASRRRR